MRNLKRVLSAKVALLTLLPAAVSNCSQAQDTAHAYFQVPNGAYSVVAEIQAKPGKEGELRSATLPLVPLVRHDPKNFVYFFQEDRERKGHFVFFEVYASKEDFDSHNQKPYVQAWFKRLPDLIVGKLKTTRMKVLGDVPR
jgi:quinol monooxygenase YgiN